MEKTAKLPKLKPKERLFVATYFKTDFNGTESVKKVYQVEDDGYARLKAHRLITKDNVAQAIDIGRETLKSALIDEGVTPKKIAVTINKLLDADDYNANDKGLKYSTNIYGIEDPDDKPKSDVTYNFIFNAETQEKIKKMEAEIKQQLINRNVQES